MAKITAPNKEFNGKRGQVGFTDGVGETDDPTMIAYFRRHGYEVEGAKSTAKSGGQAKSTAKSGGQAKSTAKSDS